MIPIESATTFIIASILLALAPGPDNIFVLTQSALHGRKAGVLVTLGLSSGLIVHTSAVALGIAALFQASAMAFNGLKILGALYLLYLAWQAFRSSATALDANAAPKLTAMQLYQRGIIMNVTNPKVSIFFLAFLPQFASPEHGSVIAQIMLLGLLFIVATLLVFGSVAMLAGTMGAWLKSTPRAQVYLNRVAGGVFSLLALKLLGTDGGH